METKLYAYYTTEGETVVGVVKADNITIARALLKNAYGNYAKSFKVKEIKFTFDNPHEIYYGC